MQLDITVDTQILVHASKPGVHFDFVELVKETKTIEIALDEGGLIQQEYDNKMSFGARGQELLRILASSGRIKPVKIKPLHRSIRIPLLDDEHFDPDDIKFVRAAIATASKCLVAEEDDYSSAVCKLLNKKAKVQVHKTDEVCARIKANPACDCCV